MSNILSRQATIGHSLRFNSSAANQRLSKSFGAPTTAYKWTFSSWVKRSALSSPYNPICGNTSGGINHFGFGADDKFYVVIASGTNSVSNQVFRDPTAFGHLVVYYDNAATPKLKVFWNNVELTWSTDGRSSLTSWPLFQNTITSYIGSDSSTNYFDGYLSEVVLVDGQTLTPDYFGYSDPHTGEWSPRPFNGDMGASGFYLPFTDGTSTTTLGYDKAPLRTNHTAYNNWTLNNLTRAAGINECWVLDTPTNNYQTINTIEAGSYLNGASITMGGLKFARPTGNSQTNYMSALRVPSDKWYFEVHSVTLTDSGSLNIGITQGGSSYAQLQLQSGTSLTATSGSGAQSGLAAALNTDVFGVLADLPNGTVQFYKNNIAFGTQITGLIDSGAPWFISGSISWLGGLVFNFGQRDFLYPPTGYKSMCQANLPRNGLRHPERWMDVVTYTGNGSTQFVPTSVKYPDFVWAKSRFDGATHITGNHALFDTQRGPTRYLTSNATASESLVQVKLDSFDANGFTIANNGGFEQQINYNGDPCVAWVWKAGGTPVVNNSGTISSMVSANVEAGFSIVTWNDVASGTHTIGHGLDRAPSLIIVKSRGGAYNWNIYHSALGNSAYLQFTTAAQVTGSPVWNNTSPTSSVFSITAPFAGSTAMVTYCWAEIPGFSKFGSYTGNGVVDGPYVWCGFRPRFVLTKNSGATGGSWTIHDTSRETKNEMIDYLLPNLPYAESNLGSNGIDITATGFKIRGSASGVNSTGETHIFAAFAEYPLSDALAR